MRERFRLHKKLLTSRSEYFDKAFNGPFEEAKKGRIELLEDNPAAFALFVNWLYGGQLPPTQICPFHRKFKQTLPDIKMVYPPSMVPQIAAYTPVFGQQEQPGVSVLCSIASRHPFEDFSHEELRLRDYARHKRYSHAYPPDLATLNLTSNKQQTIPASLSTFPIYNGPGRIPGIPASNPSPVSDIEIFLLQQRIMLDLCIFTDKICLNGLFNQAMDIYLQNWHFHETSPPDSHIEAILLNSHPSSPCYRYVVDCAVHEIGVMGKFMKYHQIFVQLPFYQEAVFVALENERAHHEMTFLTCPAPWDDQENKCRYHLHIGFEDCETLGLPSKQASGRASTSVFSGS
jgi:hypothetical protein